MSNDRAQSDLVRLVLDIPYMSPEMRDDFEFSLEGYSRVIKHVSKSHQNDEFNFNAPKTNLSILNQSHEDDGFYKDLSQVIDDAVFYRT